MVVKSFLVKVIWLFDIELLDINVEIFVLMVVGVLGIMWMIGVLLLSIFLKVEISVFVVIEMNMVGLLLKVVMLGIVLVMI